MYNLHIHSAAATAALYNTIDPKANVYLSTHPVRQILDWFADPTYVSEFHASLFATGYAAGPRTSAGVPDLLSLFNAYAQRGVVHNDTTWDGSKVASQLASSGLSEERFSNSENGAWAELPAVAMNLAIRKDVVAPFATEVVNAAYASDAAVASDEAVQAFAAALGAARGSNLGRINAAGSELKTKAQLAGFIEDFITIVLTHGSAHLQDYSMRVLNVAPLPPRMGRQTAPLPDGQYSDAEVMQWVPTTGTAARQYTFVANFVGTTMLPITNLGEQIAGQDSGSWPEMACGYCSDNV